MRSKPPTTGQYKKGQSGNPGGRTKNQLTFTHVLQEMLTRKKKFQKPDGTYMDSTDLQVIAAKIIRELKNPKKKTNVRLFDTVLTRIEGKPKESVSIDGSLEVSRGIDAKEVLLSRISRLIKQKEDVESDTESD